MNKITKEIRGSSKNADKRNFAVQKCVQISKIIAVFLLTVIAAPFVFGAAGMLITSEKGGTELWIMTEAYSYAEPEEESYELAEP